MLHVPDQLNQRVRDRDSGLVRAAAAGDLAVLGAEVAAPCCVRLRGRPRSAPGGSSRCLGGGNSAALPPDSCPPGQTPAQDTRSPGVGNLLMSAPVSAMITSIVRRSNAEEVKVAEDPPAGHGVVGPEVAGSGPSTRPKSA